MNPPEEVVASAQGFPYTLQLFGDATWNAAGRPDPGGRLTADHVAHARTVVDNDLAALFRARWEKATPAEQLFITSMAQLGDGPARLHWEVRPSLRTAEFFARAYSDDPGEDFLERFADEFRLTT